MKQHYVPEVYLRQWCDDDAHLIRYCRVGRPGALPQLHSERKAPKGICWERNLYSLPDGGIANGMTGDELEGLLSKKVEQVLASIVGAVGDRVGPLELVVSDQVKWLMQTFVARSPSTLAAIESVVVDFALENGALIRRTLTSARAPEMRAELCQYLDPRMPAVAARAGLAGLVDAQFLPMPGWYEGSLCVLQVEGAKPLLDALGLDHFPTFEEPVVQWQANPAGLVASFSVSPRILALVVTGSAESLWELALRHTFSALRHRQFAICRRRAADGPWLTEAHNLIPWTPGD